MLDLLAQTLPSVINKPTAIKMLIWGGLTAIGAVAWDLHCWGQAPAGAKWSWKLTAAHAGYGFVSGAFLAIGLTITAPV
jgi:hypothetical protein